MKTSLKKFNKEFLGLVLELSWRQWSTLGVSGHDSSRDRAVIDPEALLILTTVFGRYEPRLFDEVLDWLRLNGALMNLQRLGNLSGNHDFGDRQVLAAMAHQLDDKAVLRKWKRVAEIGGSDAKNQAASLFRSLDGTDLPSFGPKDTGFAQWGLTRGKLKFRGLSQRPNPAHPANFLFKLRSFFGLNARSEVILYLLTHGVVHPRRIAEHTGYSPGTVEKTLNEMQFSGFVFCRSQARLKLFSLESENWNFMTQGVQPVWADWAFLFSSLHALWKIVGRPDQDGRSALLLASELRRVMEKISVTVGASSYPGWFSIPPGLTGEPYVQAILERTLILLKDVLRGCAGKRVGWTGLI